MKSLALCAAPRSLGWALVAYSSAFSALCVACESSRTSDAPRPSASVKVHPPFSVPKTPEMEPAVRPAALRADNPLPRKPLKSTDKKDWQENCKIQHACAPEAKPLPPCEANVARRPWIDVVSEGKAVVGKEVEVSGTLGLSLIKKTGSGECAAGACCHTLEMQIVLIGEPTGSLPLRGLTCSGDDSALCCSVPTEGQTVVARGRLRKLDSGVSQWQLDAPSLCVIDDSPQH